MILKPLYDELAGFVQLTHTYISLTMCLKIAAAIVTCNVLKWIEIRYYEQSLN